MSNASYEVAKRLMYYINGNNSINPKKREFYGVDITVWFGLFWVGLILTLHVLETGSFRICLSVIVTSKDKSDLYNSSLAASNR